MSDVALGAAEALSVPARLLWTLACIDPDAVRAASSAAGRGDCRPYAGMTRFSFLAHLREHLETTETDGFRGVLQEYVDAEQAAELVHAHAVHASSPDSAGPPAWDLLLGEGADGRVAVDEETWHLAEALDALVRSGPGRVLIAPSRLTSGARTVTISRLDGLSYQRARATLRESLDLGTAVAGVVLDVAEETPAPTVLTLLEVTRQVEAVRAAERIDEAAGEGVVELDARTTGRHAGELVGVGAGRPGRGISQQSLGDGDGHDELYRELDVLGRKLRQAGAFELLESRLSAPVERSGEALRALQQAVAADRRSWRWMVWPRPVQVLRQAAYDVGRIDHQRDLADQHAGRVRLAAWQASAEADGDAAADGDVRLGALAASAPRVVDGPDLSAPLVRLVTQTRGRIHRARSRLGPRHRTPDVSA